MELYKIRVVAAHPENKGLAGGPQLPALSLWCPALGSPVRYIALQLCLSDPNPSLFFADDLLIEAAKSGDFSKVGALAVCHDTQPGLALNITADLQQLLLRPFLQAAPKGVKSRRAAGKEP